MFLTEVNDIGNDIDSIAKFIIKFIENNRERSRAHGLGMVQFEVPISDVTCADTSGFDACHIHIWHPHLSSFDLEETGHQHRFDMLSYVVVGYVNQIENLLVEGSDYDLILFDGDDQQKIIKERKTSVNSKLFKVESGKKYFMPHKAYHQFDISNIAVTLILKRNAGKQNRALFPVGNTPMHGRDSIILNKINPKINEIIDKALVELNLIVGA
jgi:hypothetical protein